MVLAGVMGHHKFVHHFLAHLVTRVFEAKRFSAIRSITSLISLRISIKVIPSHLVRENTRALCHLDRVTDQEICNFRVR